MNNLWKIHLFKGLRVARVTDDEQIISRFRTHKTGALLAFLAFHPQAHAREVLIEMFWPESESRVGGQSLRTALASLRRQLEPPGVPESSVLIATRTTIQLNPQTIQTDVADFHLHAQTARRALENEEIALPAKIAFLERAVDSYQGALLPGFYEEWIALEAQRLEEEYSFLLGQLLHHLEAARDLPRALHWAREGVLRDPAGREIRASLKRFSNALGVPFDLLDLPDISASTVQQPPRKKPRRKKKSPPAALIPVIMAAQSTPSARVVSLPALLDRFFGRQAEVARVCEEFTIRQTRLLTLTGIGGSGKTRLAIEAAHQISQTKFSVLSADQRAIFYVPLADLREGELILSAVLETLSLPRAKGFLTGVSPEARPADRLCAALSSHPTLLVLDNFEHLAAIGAQFVEMLLSRVPHLQILVTSQHRLNIPGERELPLGALPVPLESLESPMEKEDLPALLDFAGIQLFLDRAQTIAPDFQLTSHNAASIVEICRVLEGVPLAIELAGARCNVFSPSQIALKLRDVREKFATLTNVRRPATPRHASLTTAISWSFDLLPPELAQFWTQLSVFRGGFSLESAQTVCRQPNAAHWLGQLRAYSLVSVEEQGGAMRFRLLEMLREFAQAKLEPKLSREIGHRHARHFEETLSASLSLLRTAQESQALQQAAAETDNARAALHWAHSQCRVGKKPVAARQREYSLLSAGLAHAQGTLLQRRGLHGEALNVLESGLEATALLENQTDLRINLLREHAGVLLDLQAESASRSAREMLLLCRKQKDQAGIAAATNLLGLAAKAQRDWPQARKNCMDALSRFEKLDDVVGIAIAHNNLGLIEYHDEAGDKELAQNHLHRGLELRQKLDDARGTAEAHINLGALAQQVGKIEDAQNHYQSALKIEQQLQHAFGVGRALCNLGEVFETRGEIPRAFRSYASAHALFELAGVAYREYSATQSARLAGEIPDCSILRAQAQAFARAGALEDLVMWATN